MKNSREQIVSDNEQNEATEKMRTKCAYCGKSWELGIGEWRSCMGGRDSKGKKFKEHESSPIYIGVKKNGEVINNIGGAFETFRHEFER